MTFSRTTYEGNVEIIVTREPPDVTPTVPLNRSTRSSSTIGAASRRWKDRCSH